MQFTKAFSTVRIRLPDIGWGRHRAAVLFGPAPGGPFGMDMLDYLGWIHEGGGLELYQDLYQKELQRNVVVMPMTSVGQSDTGLVQEAG